MENVLIFYSSCLTPLPIKTFVKSSQKSTTVYLNFIERAKSDFRKYLSHDVDPYHIETSPLICRANQWTGFYMIGTSVMKELKAYLRPCQTFMMDLFVPTPICNKLQTDL